MTYVIGNSRLLLRSGFQSPILVDVSLCGRGDGVSFLVNETPNDILRQVDIAIAGKVELGIGPYLVDPSIDFVLIAVRVVAESEIRCRLLEQRAGGPVFWYAFFLTI